MDDPTKKQLAELVGRLVFRLLLVVAIASSSIYLWERRKSHDSESAPPTLPRITPVTEAAPEHNPGNIGGSTGFTSPRNPASVKDAKIERVMMFSGGSQSESSDEDWSANSIVPQSGDGQIISAPGLSIRQTSEGQVVSVAGGISIIQNANGQTITVGGMTIQQGGAGQSITTEVNQNNNIQIKTNKGIWTDTTAQGR